MILVVLSLFQGKDVLGGVYILDRLGWASVGLVQSNFYWALLSVALTVSMWCVAGVVVGIIRGYSIVQADRENDRRNAWKPVF